MHEGSKGSNTFVTVVAICNSTPLIASSFLGGIVYLVRLIVVTTLCRWGLALSSFK